MGFGSKVFIILMTNYALEGVHCVGEVGGPSALRSVEVDHAPLNGDMVVLVVTKLGLDPALAEECWGLGGSVFGRGCSKIIGSDDHFCLLLLFRRLLNFLFLGRLGLRCVLNLACDVVEEAHEIVFGLALHLSDGECANG